MNQLIGPGRDEDEDDDLDEDDEDDDESLHMVPAVGRPHVASYDCWCRPEAETDGNCAPVWVHRLFH